MATSSLLFFFLAFLVVNISAECKPLTVEAGDTCTSLAEKCSIAIQTLAQYNTAKDFCSTLVRGRQICCTSVNHNTKIPIQNSTSNQSPCFKNCSTEINKSSPAKDFITVGYYQSWNLWRDCVTLEVANVNTTKYTHLHWAFGSITPAFDVDIDDPKAQWQGFVGLKGIKRILSIGASEDFQRAVRPSNAETFANNIVNFINTHNIDGIDLDWEYPGATNLPGIAPGQPSDGPNYLSFLQILRTKLPKEKIISIAAPPSDWHLRNFPITQMAEILDYIVVMTYDLHSQSDYGNPWIQPGCLEGNCLRSHVNLTETNSALSMIITQARVPPKKLIIGLAAYGRAYTMTNTTCTSPMCTYHGPESTALMGRCTKIQGFLSLGEIEQEVLATERGWYEESGESNVLVYGGNQWVSYLNRTTMGKREMQWREMGFGGTVLWTVDLMGGEGW